MNKKDTRDLILRYMENYCYGVDNAQNKKVILCNIGIKIDERMFRQIASEMKKENLICSLSSVGYWFHPLATNNRREIEAWKASCEEMESRAKKMLTSMSRNIAQADAKLRTLSGEQPELQLPVGR